MTEATYSPKDNDGVAIPLLRFKSGGAQKITSNAGGTARTTELTSSVVSIYATQDVIVNFGDADTVTAAATDHFIPAGVYMDVALKSKRGTRYSYIAARTKTTAAEVYISERV
jgi:hypothetical protein